MKKTTKILLVLAAVVAMTIGAMSTVMAADVYRVVDPASWELQDNDTWQAKDTDGKQLENCWATDADGKWYYFDGKTALQEEFLKWRGDYYYFDENCFMCTRWVEFEDDELADVEDYLDSDIAVLGQDGSEDTAYEESIWCFFGTDGVAVFDEWVNDYGLWYYFDGMVMVCDDYYYDNVAGDNKIYGFSGDGNMHVGWVKVTQTSKSNKGNPLEKTNTDGNSYVYYNNKGEMATEGWNKIDGVWYYFVSNDVAGSKFANVIDAEAAIMVHSAYLKLDGGNYFYFDKNGVMQTGSQDIAKKQKLYVSAENFIKGTQLETVDRVTTLVFDTTGAQLFADKAKDGKWYWKDTDEVYAVGDGEAATGSAIVYATGDKFTGKEKTDIKGEMITSAFRVARNDAGVVTTVYYYDASGNIVKSDVVDIKVGDVILTLAFDKDGKLYNKDDSAKVKISGTYYYFNSEAFGTIEFDGVEFAACGTKKPVED